MSENLAFSSYVSALPFQVGYELNEQHLVAVGLTVDGRPGPVVVASRDHPDLSDRDVSELLAARAGRVASQGAAARFLLVAYGPGGDARAEQLADAMLGTLDTLDPVLVHVENHSLRARLLSGTEWSRPQELPVAAAAIFEGAPQPAADRAGLAARFAPAPATTFAALTESERVKLSASPPSLRAEVAGRALEKLSVPGSVDDPALLAAVAHLATDPSGAVRDALVTAAASDEARTEALVRVYRGAPEAVRPGTATLASAALFLRGAPSPAIAEVLRHADHVGRHARFTSLIEAAMESGANPHDLRRAIAATVPQSLAVDDAKWDLANVSSTRAASFPAPAAGARTEGVQTRPAQRAAGPAGPVVER